MYLDEIAEDLKAEEGFSEHCYMCTAGAHTIGYGRNIDAANGGIGITEAEADYLLRNDIMRTIEEVRRWSWFDQLDDVRKSVLVQLAFQLGITRLSKFERMLAALAEGNYDQAADELLDSLFARQVPSRAERLQLKIRYGST
jgi:lysozyme